MTVPMERPGRTIERQELERLRALNAELVEVLDEMLQHDPALSAATKARATIAKAKSEA